MNSRSSTPQQLVEYALKASRSDHCVAIVRDSTSANLRWANNTLTTNGVMHGVSVTVVAFRNGAEGVATGSVTAPPARWPPSRPRRRPAARGPGRSSP